MEQNQEPLAFDAPPEQDIEIKSSPQVDNQTSSIDDFKNLDPSTRRLKILYAIKQGKLDIDVFPSYLRSHIKNFAELIVPSKIDGRLVVNPELPPNSPGGKLKPKVDNLIISGKVGDLADAVNNPMWTDLSNSIFTELEPMIHSFKDSHPSRKFDALEKSGKLDDMIAAHMRKKNFDLFAKPSWFKGALKAVALQRSREASQERQGNIKESDFLRESIRIQLQTILYG